MPREGRYGVTPLWCQNGKCKAPAAFRVVWSDPEGCTTDLCRECVIDAVVVHGQAAPDVACVGAINYTLAEASPFRDAS